MFNSAIDKYYNSVKSKEDKIQYLRELHKGMMQVKQLEQLINMENSVIKSFEVTKEGTYIVLNDSRGKIKIFFDDKDCEEASVEVMCSLDYETNETETMLSIVSGIMNENFVAFDIGSNIGWYTLLINGIYKNSTVFSFEPAPITYKRLIRNLQLNGFSTNNAFNIGLYNKKSKLDFYYDVEGSGGSSMINLRGREKVDKIQVNVETLDEFTNGHFIDKIDFIKCDVEGSEYFVYQGGIETIKKYRPVIFSEMLRKWSAKFNYSPNDIIKFFREIGYDCFAVSGKCKLRFCPFVDEDTVETNYYFLHREKHEKLIKQYMV